MISSRPNSATALSTAAFISSSLPTSARVARILTPGVFCAIFAAAAVTASSLMSTRRTLAPSSAKRMADSRPMPLWMVYDELCASVVCVEIWSLRCCTCDQSGLWAELNRKIRIEFDRVD